MAITFHMHFYTHTHRFFSLCNPEMRLKSITILCFGGGNGIINEQLKYSILKCSYSMCIIYIYTIYIKIYTIYAHPAVTWLVARRQLFVASRILAQSSIVGYRDLQPMPRLGLLPLPLPPFNPLWTLNYAIISMSCGALSSKPRVRVRFAHCFLIICSTFVEL